MAKIIKFKPAQPYGSMAMQATSLDASPVTVSSAATDVLVAAVDARSNGADPAYLKLYDGSAPTVGTTDPYMILYAPPGTMVGYASIDGIAFANAVTAAALRTGGTGGTDPPARGAGGIVVTM